MKRIIWLANLTFAGLMAWFTQPLVTVLDQWAELHKALPYLVLSLDSGFVAAFVLLQFCTFRSKHAIIMAIVSNFGVGMTLTGFDSPSLFLLGAAIFMYALSSSLVFEKLYSSFLDGLPYDDEDKRRKMLTRRSTLCFVVGMIAGIVIFASLPISPWVWSGVASALLLLILILLCFLDEPAVREKSSFKETFGRFRTQKDIYLVLAGTTATSIAMLTIDMTLAIILLQKKRGGAGSHSHSTTGGRMGLLLADRSD